MKFVRVTMPDKSQYDVPLQVVKEKLAQKDATAEADSLHPEGRYKDTAWQQTYDTMYANTLDELGLRTDSYVVEQAEMNLLWKSHIEEYAVRVTKPEKVDLQEGWIDGRKEVIEK